MTTESSSQHYRAIFEQSPIGIVVYGGDLRVLDCNESFAKLIDSSRERVIGLSIDDLRDQRHRAAVLQALEGETVTFESPYQATTSEAWPWLRATFGPLRNSEGQIDRVIVVVSDRAAQVGATRAVRSTETQLSETQRFGRIGSWTWDAERRIAAGSPEFHRILGMSLDWEIAEPEEFASLILPEDRQEFRAQLEDTLARRLTLATREFRIRRPDETIRWVALQAEANFALDGRLLSAWGLIQDVTERRQLEDQLRQSQKMEAMGLLAAGVAHDFNNLLTVIKVEAAVLGNELGGNHGAQEPVLGIQSAADRAAGLTRQLLAFSRRQLLRPVLLDVNETVAGASQMLARLIGDDIELLTDLRPNVPPIFADSGQLMQVLVNLAVNARDAMPRGGKLSITTGIETIGDEYREGNIPLGTYVVIVVSDTGLGMDEATRRRIFEPFFTTKTLGTGLGLSTVYGIMNQSAGHITVASEPGEGAMFKLYFLPQTTESEVRPDAHQVSGEGAALPRTATILLAEDEPAVRRVCHRVLSREGHEVLVAEDGHEALSVAKNFPGHIDLLLTDMVLPTLSGRDLYDRLRLKRPSLRVLYMTGYSDEEIVRRGLIDNNARVLEKPFASTELVTAVRAALESA